MIYCKPKFGTGFFGRGMGFGGRLLPWARCRVFSKIHGVPMISPIWARPAVNQIFRGGVDYQSYMRQLVLVGLMQRRRGDLGVVSGRLRTMLVPSQPEPDDLRQLPDVPAGESRKIIFATERGYFQQLNGWDEYLHAELRAIARPKYLALASSFGSPGIGICVRAGNDFPAPSSDRKHLLPGERTPLTWFIEMLRLVREAAGYVAPAVVVSDGSFEQLAPLLAQENVRFVRPAAAISDLLVLSSTKVLLASGSSQFSAWGMFLGQMPTASHPGQSLHGWNLEPRRGQFLGEVDAESPDSQFLAQAREALR